MNKEFSIDQVSFVVDTGQCTVLLGESGSGKSTLARMLIGLVYPESGSIEVDGETLSHHNIEQLRAKFGYVIQSFGLFPHLTAQDNVGIAWQGKPISKNELSIKIKDTAQLCHFLPEKLQRFPIEMSGGEKQRVALMRALINDPEYLILDEPLGALDPITRNHLQHELKEIFVRLNKTVILVTHDINEAQFFGDQVILLKKGKIVQKGSFSELKNHPRDAFVKEFMSHYR